MDPLSLGEKIHSTRNRLFWNIRSAIRFQRAGYQEQGSEEERKNSLSCLNQKGRSTWIDIENRYSFKDLLGKLSIDNYRKNLFTLWSLERMFAPKPETQTILEVGSQDFSRLPAYQRYFAQSSIRGMEIDPYPILQELHSRMDKAQYYISLSSKPAQFSEGDFFQFSIQQNLIICFYPFVSANPALAWGLPAQLGNPELWVRALDNNLANGASALIVHQGDWEEEEFDRARTIQPHSLELVERKILDCPFFETRYPAHASVYKKKGI